MEASKRELRERLNEQRRFLDSLEESLIFGNRDIEHALTNVTELLFEPYHRDEFFRSVVAVAKECYGWEHLGSSSFGLKYTFGKIEEEE